MGTELPRSIFVNDDTEVFDVPMSVIRRPLPSDLDENKVQTFMKDIEVKGEQVQAADTDGQKLTPIEVMWVTTDEGNYYFATGGCHRWEAHTRLKTPTIPARLIKVPPATLSLFMGASSPFARQQTGAQAQEAGQQQQPGSL